MFFYTLPRQFQIVFAGFFLCLCWLAVFLLAVFSSFWSFGSKHLKRLVKRLLYDYFLRDFNVETVEIVAGLLCVGFGLVYGSRAWIDGIRSGVANEPGVLFIATVPLVLGFQFLMGAFNYDIARQPRSPLSRLLPKTGSY